MRQRPNSQTWGVSVRILQNRLARISVMEETLHWLISYSFIIHTSQRLLWLLLSTFLWNDWECRSSFLFDSKPPISANRLFYQRTIGGIGGSIGYGEKVCCSLLDCVLMMQGIRFQFPWSPWQWKQEESPACWTMEDGILLNMRDIEKYYKYVT